MITTIPRPENENISDPISNTYLTQLPTQNQAEDFGSIGKRLFYVASINSASSQNYQTSIRNQNRWRLIVSPLLKSQLSEALVEEKLNVSPDSLTSLPNSSRTLQAPGLLLKGSLELSTRLSEAVKETDEEVDEDILDWDISVESPPINRSKTVKMHFVKGKRLAPNLPVNPEE